MPRVLRQLLALGLDLALVVGGIASALLVAELALRLFIPAKPNFYRPDYYLGWTNRPGASGIYSYEGHSEVRINADGQRDVTHPKAKPPGTFRIAVLGDSFTEAVQVPQAENFCSVMEGALRQCAVRGGAKPEVINFGVTGYGTLQELLQLRRQVWQYSPDMVVLAFYPGNDVPDNVKALSPAAWPRPYAYLDDGQVRIDNSFRQSLQPASGDPAEYNLRHAYLYHLRLYRIFHRLEFLWWNDILGGPIFHITRGNHADESEPLLPPQSQHWRDAWTITEKLLGQMSREVAAHGARFLVVVLSDSYQVYPDPARRAELLRMLGVADPFYVNHRLKAIGEREGVQMLNLGEPFQRYAEAHRVFLHGFRNFDLGFGHWNAAGHALAGKMIAERVCEMASQPGSPAREQEAQASGASQRSASAER